MARTTRGRGIAAQPASEKWAEILAAATKLFLAKGYAATSMQDVSSAVGLLKGSLYHYIDSKEDLLYHVLRDLHAGAMPYLEQCEASREPPLDRLRTLIEQLVPYIAERATQSAIFFRDITALPAHRQRQIIRERDVYARAIHELILAAQRRRDLPAGIDARLAALTLLGAMSWVYQWYRPQGRLSAVEIGREQAEMLLNGLVHAEPRRDARAARVGRVTLRRNASARQRA